MSRDQTDPAVSYPASVGEQNNCEKEPEFATACVVIRCVTSIVRLGFLFQAKNSDCV